MSVCDEILFLQQHKIAAEPFLDKYNMRKFQAVKFGKDDEERWDFFFFPHIWWCSFIQVGERKVWTRSFTWFKLRFLFIVFCIFPCYSSFYLYLVNLRIGCTMKILTSFLKKDGQTINIYRKLAKVINLSKRNIW